MRRTTLSLAALAVSLLGSPASLSVALGVAVVDAEGHSLELETEVSAEEEMVVSPPVPWSGANGNVEDLHREYNNIFRYGNRNAASHLWATFLLERAPQMTDAKLQEMFTGFCAVSGSPVYANDYKRYKLTLPALFGAAGNLAKGFMYYCCWPCVCDTHDFIRVDTKTITTADGPKTYRFAVIGNPCENPAALDEPFVQPFDRRRTTLAREAAEVRCGPGSELIGATLSDHGYPIISLFFDAPAEVESAVVVGPGFNPTPGRMTQLGGVGFQDEAEYDGQCEDRAAGGYKSGMGEIFRRVAMISPVQMAGAPVGLVLDAAQHEGQVPSRSALVEGRA